MTEQQLSQESEEEVQQLFIRIAERDYKIDLTTLTDNSDFIEEAYYNEALLSIEDYLKHLKNKYFKGD